MRLELDGEWVMRRRPEPRVQLLRVTRVLDAAADAFQHARDRDTEATGGAAGSTASCIRASGTSFIYHEALVHPAMLLHPSPAQVLIQAAARAPRCARSSLTKRARGAHGGHRPARWCGAAAASADCSVRGSFEDPRARLVIDDARRELERGGARL
jgi:spermidine synthase